MKEAFPGLTPPQQQNPHWRPGSNGRPPRCPLAIKEGGPPSLALAHHAGCPPVFECHVSFVWTKGLRGLCVERSYVPQLRSLSPPTPLLPWLTTPAATPVLTAVVMVATSLTGYKGAGRWDSASASFTSQVSGPKPL